MRVTIVKPDSMVCVDGLCFSDIDMSSLESDVVALQWYDTKGDLETMTPDGRYNNTAVTSLDPFRTVLDQWTVKKEQLDASQANA